MNALLIMLVAAAPQKAAPHITIAAKACSPLLESQAEQLKLAYASGLSALEAAGQKQREDEIARIKSEYEAKLSAMTEAHEAELARLSEKHAKEMEAAKSRWMDSTAACMNAMLTIGTYDDVHNLDDQGNNDLYVRRAVACEAFAALQFEVRQLLDDKPFRLRQVAVRSLSSDIDAVYSSDWLEPGVLSGTAVIELNTATPESVDIVFRGVDSVAIDDVKLVQ